MPLGDPDGKICSVQHLLDMIKRIVPGASRHAHIRWWFRGQSKWGWPLHPGVYRDNFPVKNKADRLNVEQHLTQDFTVESAGLRRGDESNSELYFLQQHYRMPTRLLDWTTSPLAALYFVVCDEPKDADGALFVMDAYQLANCQDLGGVDFKGIATSRGPILKTALKPIFSWESAAVFPKFIFPVRPDHFERRVGIQRSCFTFHVPQRSVLTKEANRTLQCLRVPKDKKASLREELFRLGVDQFTVYGDLESLARRLKLAYGVRA